MRPRYFLATPCGTFWGGVPAYFFIYNARLVGGNFFADLETLSAEEIGQELGGN